MGRLRNWLTLAAVASLAVPVQAQDPADPQAILFDAGGYRTMRFRAPVTRDPYPAAAIALAAARKLVPGRNALFIDVLPVEGGVRDHATGNWRMMQSHQTIAGALWHPETGRIPPDPMLWAALRRDIAVVRSKRPKLPIVVFCRSDCWMGWNAARRLANEGVSNVWWLAEGIEGWHSTGGRLVDARPVAVPDQQSEGPGPR